MSLMDELKAYEKTEKFQKEATKAIREKRKAGGGTGGFVEDKAQARKVVDEILDKIRNAIALKLPNIWGTILLFNAAEWFDPTVDQNGNYCFSINFDDIAVHRDSLYPAKYKDGLRNVVMLLSHGSKPLRKGVGGLYLGTHYYIPKGWKRDKDPFLIDAVDALNVEYNEEDIKITLSKDYY